MQVDELVETKNQFIVSIANSSSVLITPSGESKISLFNISGQQLNQWKSSEPYTVDMSAYDGTLFFFIEENENLVQKAKYTK